MGELRLRRERIAVVRRMQASVLRPDPLLDAMCEALADVMAADAVVATLLFEHDQVFIGAYGLPDSPGTIPRQFDDDILKLELFEELRMDLHPAMARNTMVHGPHDRFRSVASLPLNVEGAVVGALHVLTRTHRKSPYDATALNVMRQARAGVQAHLAFGVLIRAPKDA